MAVTADKIFVNLPVKDLQKTINFFTEIGFEFNPQFTDENATCMIISDKIFVMLLVESFFKTFTTKEIANTTNHVEAIIAITMDNRAKVDELVDKALAAGGKAFNEPKDHGFMYVRSFQDVDNHLWEIFYMDESAPPQE